MKKLKNISQKIFFYFPHIVLGLAIVLTPTVYTSNSFTQAVFGIAIFLWSFTLFFILLVCCIAAIITFVYSKIRRTQFKSSVFFRLLLLPIFIIQLLVITSDLKARIIVSPVCENKLKSIKDKISIKNVQTQPLDRDKNNELDTVRVDFDIEYTGEDTTSALTYAKLATNDEYDQLLMWQWDGLPVYEYPHSYPEVVLNTGSTHVIRYMNITENVPSDILPKHSNQTLDIEMKYDMDQNPQCFCYTCEKDVFKIGKYRESTQFDLMQFTQDPFTYEEYVKIKNKDSI